MRMKMPDGGLSQQDCNRNQDMKTTVFTKTSFHKYITSIITVITGNIENSFSNRKKFTSDLFSNNSACDYILNPEYKQFQKLRVFHD